MTEEQENKAQNEDLKNAPKFRVNGFYIKDMSFESPMAPEIFTKQAAAPKLEMSVDVIVSKIEGTAFEVALKTSAKAVGEEGSMFMIELLHAAIFVLNPELPKDEMEKTLLIDCPNVIFPFTRRVIADTVQDGGFAPLILDPVNFEAIYAAKKESSDAVKN